MNTETDIIRAYHAHIYFPEGDRAACDAAEVLRQAIIGKFDGIKGTAREVPGGPHFVPMLQVDFPVAQFANAVPWLALNRGSLSVLVHPVTGDEVADHGDYAMWLGEPQPINFDALRSV